MIRSTTVVWELGHHTAVVCLDQSNDGDLREMAGPDQVGWAAELRAMAEKLGIGARVHWPGMLTGAAKWSALMGCDAFILPSHQENFGVAVAEALASGVPVLISDKINIWREIVGAGAGIVEPDTEDGTFNLLSAFFRQTPEERAAMGEKALAAYEKYFSVDVSARALEKLLRSAVRPGEQ